MFERSEIFDPFLLRCVATNSAFSSLPPTFSRWTLLVSNQLARPHQCWQTENRSCSAYSPRQFLTKSNLRNTSPESTRAAIYMVSITPQTVQKQQITDSRR